MTRETLLRARNLKVYRGGAQVLEVAALDLRSGEVLALMGPNGAGKSTLMLTLAGLLPPLAGELQFRDIRLQTRADRDAFRRRMTMVFQDPLLFDATVAQNIASGLALRGVPAAERKPRVEDWARRLGRGKLLDRSAINFRTSSSSSVNGASASGAASIAAWAWSRRARTSRAALMSPMIAISINLRSRARSLSIEMIWSPTLTLTTRAISSRSRSSRLGRPFGLPLGLPDWPG